MLFCVFNDENSLSLTACGLCLLGRMEWPLHGSVESIGKPSVARTHVGAQHPAQDVQSFW